MKSSFVVLVTVGALGLAGWKLGWFDRAPDPATRDAADGSQVDDALPNREVGLPEPEGQEALPNQEPLSDFERRLDIYAVAGAEGIGASLVARGALELARGGSAADPEFAQLIDQVATSKDEAANLAQALVAARAGPLERRDALQLLLEEGAVPLEDRPVLRDALLASNAETLFKAKTPLRVEVYDVVGGDSLDRICRRYRERDVPLLTPGLLQLVNGMTGTVIRVGQKLRIPLDPPRIVVSKGSRMLRYYLGDHLLREYRVTIGKDGKTPPGEYRVKSRLVKCPWLNPLTGKLVYFGDPEYAIGTRWLGFDDTADATGLGIHGTNDPASIGGAESLGCIRLLNENVEDLFELVAIGTTVHVVEDSWPGI